MFLILIGGLCLCSRRTRQRFLRPVTKRWTRLSGLATAAASSSSPATRRSAAAAARGNEAHRALVDEAEPMAGSSASNNIAATTATTIQRDPILPRRPLPTATATSTAAAANPSSFSASVSTSSSAAARVLSTVAPSFFSTSRSVQRTSQQSTTSDSAEGTAAAAAAAGSGPSSAASPVRQFPITKTFGRASWATRSWYGRSWHSTKSSWHASQTFAPPMSKLPDPPLPPPVSMAQANNKYSVFPRAMMAGRRASSRFYGGGGGGGGAGVEGAPLPPLPGPPTEYDYDDEEAALDSRRGTQQTMGTFTSSFYSSVGGLRPAPPPSSQSQSHSQSQSQSQPGQAVTTTTAADIPQVVIYSATPRVSAQTPILVDPDYSSVAATAAASQASMHSGGGASSHSSGMSSPTTTEGAKTNSSSTAARDTMIASFPFPTMGMGMNGGNSFAAPPLAAGTRETQESLVEVKDLPRSYYPSTATAPSVGAGLPARNGTTTTTTVSRFSQVSDLSSASANTGYSWDEGASDLYTADRTSTLSRIAGGFGLSIVSSSDRYPPVPLPPRPGGNAR